MNGVADRRAVADSAAGDAPTVGHASQDAARHGPARSGVPATNDRAGRRVGPVVALTYRASIDQPQRFVHSRAVGAHVGLTPRRHQSGELDYDGGISRSADTMLRTMLYEAAQILMTQSRHWSWLKAWGMKVAQRRGMRRAIVAVARRLAVVLHRMWMDGTDFRWGSEPGIAVA